MARESRKEETRKERRRRGNVEMPNQLAIPPEIAEKLEREGKKPRWLNDYGARIHNKTVADDFDIVEGVEPILGGTDRDGRPYNQILAAKPKEFVEEDKRRKEEERRANEKGNLVDVSANEELSNSGEFYVTDESERLKRA